MQNPPELASAVSTLDVRRGSIEELRRNAPFVIATAVPFVALLVPPHTHDVSETVVAAALTTILLLTWALARRLGWAAWVDSALALAYLPIVALLRDSEGGASSGYGPLVLIPLLWIALYGGRRALAACIVGIGLVLVLPIIFIGGTGYDEDSEARRALIWILAALLVGPTVQELVRRTRASEQRFRSLFERVHEVVFQTDLAGRWVVLNPAWTEITGHQVGASIGRRFIEFVHPDDIAGTERRFEHLMQRPTTDARHELRCRAVDGRWRWVELRARRVDGEDREPLGVSGTLTDINDRYEAERMKEQFFALVSHELRTPLAAIVGYLELLRDEEGDRLSDDGRRFLAVMQRNGQRLMRLIDDLLFAAQVEAGELALVRRPVDLCVIVRDACESARPRARQRDLRLDRELAEAVAPFTGDPDRLGQALDNLLTNAIKFTPEGGNIEVRLRRETRDDGRDVYVLEVEDSGPGIPESEQRRLFERFQRARAADEQAIPGVGLGLAITRSIVQGHGGRIRLRSQPGAGTTFEVELPAPAEGGLTSDRPQ